MKSVKFFTLCLSPSQLLIHMDRVASYENLRSFAALTSDQYFLKNSPWWATFSRLKFFLLQNQLRNVWQFISKLMKPKPKFLSAFYLKLLVFVTSEAASCKNMHPLRYIFKFGYLKVISNPQIVHWATNPHYTTSETQFHYYYEIIVNSITSGQSSRSSPHLSKIYNGKLNLICELKWL